MWRGKTYATVCEIDGQWKFDVRLKELKWGVCSTLEGWDGMGGGREVQEGGGICILKADSY